MASHDTYDDLIRLRVSSVEKALWEAQAKELGMSVADAIRQGTRQFFAEATTSAPTDPLMSEFKALGARLEARFRNQ